MSSEKRFGPFILERMIGRGGMGAVYRARREDTDEIVAVKALLLPLEQERERFSAEIATMKMLRHDNIVRLYGFGQEDGVLYYAMEYVNGPSLSTLLKRGRQFTWEEVVHIGALICRALKHAHDRGVVHRDIKPANILLVDDGVVKVSDYGIAQYFGSSRLTGVNQVVGTIEYMAPEQAQAGSLTPHTDMYSLGALMYVLLTGNPPYQARNLAQLLQKYRESSPDSVRLVRPETPKVVDDVIFDLLQIQTTKRPGDARVIGRRLEAILKTSANYPDDNPFKGQKFSLERKPEPENVGSSRVDLENPSDESLRESNPDYADIAPDIPYCPVSEEEPEISSPFDKTTEAAPESELAAPKGLESDSGAFDFALKGETAPAYSSHSPTSTLTGETASEVVDSLPNADSSDHDFTLSSSEQVGMTATAPSRKVEEEGVGSKRALSLLEKHNAPTIIEERSPETSTTKPSAPEAPSFEDDLEPSAAPPATSTEEMEAIPLEKFKRSQFIQVDETELDRLPRERDYEGSKYHWIRMVVMLLVFFGIVMLVADLFKTPSADKMYDHFDRKLLACRSADFEDVLRRSEKDMQKFVDTYPDDERVARVNYFLSELKIEELEVRLERQIQNVGRGAAKTPIERAYLDVCRESSDNQEKGLEKLRAFILLYGATTAEELAAFEETLDADQIDDENADFFQYGRLSSKDLRRIRPQENWWRKWNGQRRSVMTVQQQMVYIAKRRLIMLRSEIKKTNLADLALLNEQIGDILEIAQEKPERAKTMYNAALVLYGENEWAQGALETLRKKLFEPTQEDGEEPVEEAPDTTEPPAAEEAPVADS